MRCREGLLVNVGISHFVPKVRSFGTFKIMSCRSTLVNSSLGSHQLDGPGGQVSNHSKEDGHRPGPSSAVPQRGLRDLPRSTVYLSMRRLAATDDITRVIGRALKRERDGLLEAPPECTTVVFLDDVHCAQEVGAPRKSCAGRII